MRQFIDIVEQQDLFEMTNIRQARTGLPYMVFVSPRGGAQHDARIKVRLPSNEFATVGLRPEVRIIHGDIPAKDFEQIKKWAELNMAALLEFWNSEDMDSADIISMLKSI